MVTIDGMPDSVCLTRRSSGLELEGGGGEGSGRRAVPVPKVDRANLLGKRVSGTFGQQQLA